MEWAQFIQAVANVTNHFLTNAIHVGYLQIDFPWCVSISLLSKPMGKKVFNLLLCRGKPFCRIFGSSHICIAVSSPVSCFFNHWALQQAKEKCFYSMGNSILALDTNVVSNWIQNEGYDLFHFCHRISTTPCHLHGCLKLKNDCWTTFTIVSTIDLPDYR